MSAVSPSKVVLDCARAVAALGPYVVEGVVSRAKRSAAGYAYVEIKDEASAVLQLRWRSEMLPAIGDRVRAVGTCFVHAASSNLQIEVSTLEVLR